MFSKTRSLPVLLGTALLGLLAYAADWPMPAGGPQRNAWAKNERLLDKNNIKHLQLLYKFHADNTSRGLNALTQPIVNGNLITYLGFKEMLIFGASSNKVFSVDADINKVIWTSDFHVEPQSKEHSGNACWGGLTAPVVMSGSSSANRRFTAAQASQVAAAPGRTARRSAYFPPLEQTLNPLLPTTLSQLAALYTVSSDGFLHIINSSTGQDLIPAIHFVPRDARVTSLNIQENVVYATTGDLCDGTQNALYAVDLLSKDRAVSSLALQKGGFAGTSGTAIGNDGTLYVQAMFTPPGSKAPARDTLLQLHPKDLTIKDYFVLDEKKPNKEQPRQPGISPLVFPFHGRDIVMAGSKQGRIYLLDTKSLGGSDHRTPLFSSESIASRDKRYSGNGLRGHFASWLDVTSGVRWFYAPLYGPPASTLQVSDVPAKTQTGSVIALKLGEEEGNPTLQPAWISQDIASPASPVTANGMLFLLSTGEPARLAKPNGKPYSLAEWKQMSKGAKLIVLDASQGSQLYSSGDSAASSSHSGGLAIANGRAYFTAQDNMAYCFGILAGQSQLSEQH